MIGDKVQVLNLSRGYGGSLGFGGGIWGEIRDGFERPTEGH